MASSKPGSRLIKAAGGVAWRPGPDGEPEILLVHRKRYDDWSLPKGKAEPGEPLPVTAVREVLEEGGARLALGRRLASVRYNVGGHPKRVHFWAARALSVDERAVPNSEVDAIAWVPADVAARQVSYLHDHGVLADFTARPVATVPLILLRHAKALPKSGWKRSDSERPLDGSGRADAKAVADLLACFAPSARLISSPAVRCVETLRPLAQLIGQQVREVPSLYVHGKSARTGSADSPSMDAVIREAIASGEPTVVCAHRENLPALRAAALAALTGYRAAGAIPAADAPGDLMELPRQWDDTLPTAGFWVLSVAALSPHQEPPATAGAEENAPRQDGRGQGNPGRGRPSQEQPGQAVLDRDAPSARPASRPLWRRLLRRSARDQALDAIRDDAIRDDAARDDAAGDSVRGERAEADPAMSAASEPGPLGVLVSADLYGLADLS